MGVARWLQPRRRALLALAAFLTIIYFYIPSATNIEIPGDYSARALNLVTLLGERFPLNAVPSIAQDTYARRYNAPNLERLACCLSTKTCGPGENKVVILASEHFGNTQAGAVSGEDIWAASSLEAFKALNYTLLYAYGAMEVLTMYQEIPELVKTIIIEGSILQGCIERGPSDPTAGDNHRANGTWQAEPGCIKRSGFDGVPLHKVFVFHYWPNPNTPLGPNWTLSPLDYGIADQNHYLGFSIETKCSAIPYHKDRHHRGFILNKFPEAFKGDRFPWPGMLAPVAGNIEKEHGRAFTWIAAAGQSKKDGGPPTLAEPGITNLGQMEQKAWYEELARSKVMLGIGSPDLSPSPFDAMCLGVPFINVVAKRDEENPYDRTKWETQHNGLRGIRAPYIYHVMARDEEGLKNAVQIAVKTPIKRYIPPDMTREATRERHRVLVETDWYPAAKAYARQFLAHVPPTEFVI